jgi:hypothetical protein
METACEEKVDECNLHLSTRHTIYSRFATRARNWTSSNANTDPLDCEIMDPCYKMNPINEKKYVTVSLPDSYYLKRMDISEESYTL